jgi:antitoxin component of MazEF toxin-antitoxin module
MLMIGTKTIRVNRWGNGLGIRLPKEFIDSAGITETSRVEVRATDDGLMISCAQKPRRHIPLAERLKNWDGQPYELTAEDREWQAMKPAYEEIRRR